MKSRLIGLLFVLVVCCLMCLPFIVSSEAEPQPEQPVRTAVHEDALLTTPLQHNAVIEVQESGFDRVVSKEKLQATAFDGKPVSDANGLPILRTSYLRSNYQAFCLTGNGG
ncbi:MAG: hypothetical protein II879_02975 [Clostridia bacterium]|nr:hypothetical protein [Clostridia bacterium]